MGTRTGVAVLLLVGLAAACAASPTPSRDPNDPRGARYWELQFPGTTCYVHAGDRAANVHGVVESDQHGEYVLLQPPPPGLHHRAVIVHPAVGATVSDGTAGEVYEWPTVLRPQSLYADDDLPIAQWITCKTPESSPLPRPDCYWFADAVFDDGSTLVGEATKFGASVTGHLTWTTVDGDVLDSDISALECRADGGGGPGPPEHGDNNVFEIEGFGTWNGAGSFEWASSGYDHGEAPTEPRLEDDAVFTILFDDDPLDLEHGGGVVVVGNVQIETPPH